MCWYKDRGDHRRHKKVRKGGKEGSNSGSRGGEKEAKTKKRVIEGS
jgi:hypothetical protein